MTRAASGPAAFLEDRSGCGALEAAGPDAARFLHGMLTCDVLSLRPGRACPAAFLDAKGKVRALLDLLALGGGRFLLGLPSGSGPELLKALSAYLISEEAELRDLGRDNAILVLHGPSAPAVLEKALGGSVRLEPWEHEEFLLPGGAPVRVLRTDEFRLPGYQAWISAKRAGELRDAILAAGRPLGLVPLGEEARTALRVEAGTPWFGEDVTAETLFPEAPLEDRVSWSKGCYLGQETVARVKYRGHVNRLLAGLVLEGDKVPPAGSSVEAEGAEAGYVTSSAFSSSLGRPVALAYLKRESAEPGTRLGVRACGAVLPARAASLPLVKDVP